MISAIHRRDIPALCREFADYTAEAERENSVTFVDFRISQGNVATYCLSSDDLVALCDTEATSLLDKHCPEVTTRQKQWKLTPWFDAECRASRRPVRAAERQFRRTDQDADKMSWQRLC